MDMTIAQGCAALITIAAVIAILVKAVQPFRELQKRVDVLESKAERDYSAISELQRGQSVMCKLLLQIANHEIDGNHVELLRQARDDMQDYLIER